MSSLHDQNRIKVIQDYFKLSDQGRQEILELFHEDAEIYFPKFGVGLGRQSLLEMWKDLRAPSSSSSTTMTR